MDILAPISAATGKLGPRRKLRHIILTRVKYFAYVTLLYRVRFTRRIGVRVEHQYDANMYCRCIVLNEEGLVAATGKELG